jgi:hypothetical protein
MVFFSNNESDYFSLSLHPTSQSLPYFFHIDRFQKSVLTIWLNISSPVSFVTLLTTSAISIYGIIKNSFNHIEYFAVILVGLSLFIYMINVILFFWLRFKSGFSTNKSYPLDGIYINRNLSLKLYTTCLFTLLVPILGLIATGAALNINFEIAQLSTSIVKLLLISGISFIIYIILQRIIFLFNYK